MPLLLPLDFDINVSQVIEIRSAHTGQPTKGGILATPLIAAVRENEFPVVTQIIAHPRFDAARSRIDIALFAAVRVGDVPIFQALFAVVGNDVNVYNHYNESLFVYCCLRGTIAILQTIIGAASFRPLPRELQKAAAAVVRSDHGVFVPILRTLAHVDWNWPFPPGVNGDRLTGWPQKHYTGTTPFHADGAALPDIAPGTTPLVAALRYHRDTVLGALLQEPNIDKSGRGEYGQTCLWELSRVSRDLYHFMDQLAGIDLNAQDMYGNTAVTFAVISNQRDILTMLVRRGADFNIENERGETAWEIAHKLRGADAPAQPNNRDQFLRRILAIMNCSQARTYLY
jgi:hypothetical protein